MKLTNFATTLAVVCLAASNVNAISVQSDSEINAYADKPKTKIAMNIDGTFYGQFKAKFPEIQEFTKCKEGYNEVLRQYKYAFEIGMDRKDI